MKKPHAPDFRVLLRQYPDGLSTNDVVAKTGVRGNTVTKVMHGMPDVYIDRWATPRRGQFVAVWCLVNVPEDCPRPSRITQEQPKYETVWRN